MSIFKILLLNIASITSSKELFRHSRMPFVERRGLILLVNARLSKRGALIFSVTASCPFTAARCVAPHVAARQGHVAVTELLIITRCNVYLQAKEGSTWSMRRQHFLVRCQDAAFLKKKREMDFSRYQQCLQVAKS